MLENIKVQRTGYAFRQSYEEALGRYKMLSSRTWPVWKKRPKDGVKAIMEVCQYDCVCTMSQSFTTIP